MIVDDRREGAVATVTVASHRRRIDGNLPRVQRLANERDLESVERRQRKADEALAFARARARQQGLEIKIFRVEVGTRMDRALVFFASEQRVDFRGLVRDLSSHLHMRVELRQVGVRPRTVRG